MFSHTIKITLLIIKLTGAILSLLSINNMIIALYYYNDNDFFNDNGLKLPQFTLIGLVNWNEGVTSLR